ncbi:hypothetical protein, partial [Robiginitalea sp.]|uniref:hypothetical protein n=1 Tax=Robiginitalea sp. TaxID=1902411 RepID=UPI003C78F693
VSQACLSEPFGNTKPGPGAARARFVIAGRDLKGSPSEAKVIPGVASAGRDLKGSPTPGIRGRKSLQISNNPYL